jgi:serine/threonine protein kinase
MAANEDANVGRVLGGKYRIDLRLGQGGIGAVYEGVQLSAKAERPVAIKLLQNSGDHVMEQRFEREYKATAKLDHPHIVRMLDFDVDQGEKYLVMERLHGMDLFKRIKKLGRMTPLDALSIGQQVLDGLSEAHAHDIVHRDLKPANIFVCDTRSSAPYVKVLDFGIAAHDRGATGPRLTRVGRQPGTPAYMSPEQVQGHAVDARSDQYSLGVTLYEMLTTRHPYHGETRKQWMHAHVHETPQRLPGLELTAPTHEALQALLDTLMAKDPGQRFSNAKAARKALLRVSSLADAEERAFAWRNLPSLLGGGLVGLGIVFAVARPATTAVTRSESSATDASEALTPAEIDRVIRAGTPALQRCHHPQTLMAAAPDNIDTNIAIEIDRSGAVASVTLRGATRRMEKCVERSIKDWRFPRARSATSTHFSLPAAALPVVVEGSAELIEPPARADGAPLSLRQINKAVWTERQTLQRCYDAAQSKKGSRATFSISVRLGIAASGDVTSTKATGDSPGMHECVSEVVGAWRFPRARASTDTRFTLRFGPGAQSVPADDTDR